MLSVLLNVNADFKMRIKFNWKGSKREVKRYSVCVVGVMQNNQRFLRESRRRKL